MEKVKFTLNEITTIVVAMIEQIEVYEISGIDEDIYLRAKISIYSGQNKTLKMDMQTTINWILNEQDGYYYFNSTLPKDEKVTLCSYVFLDGEENYKSNTKYIATIVFESLNASEDIQKIWGYNIENDLTN